MKRLISFFVAVFLSTSFLLCADDVKKIVEEGPYVETSQTGIKLSGYVDAGYMYNFVGRGSTIQNRAVTSDAAPRGDFNLNACKIALEKPLSCENELQAGFRADLMMGEDIVSLGQNVGGSDSFTVEAAYVQLRVPYGNGINFYVGKLPSLFGYEAPDRPCNLNITNGNLSRLDPAWCTGIKMSYDINDFIQTCLVVSNGDHLDNGIGLDSNNDEASFDACIRFHKCEDACLQIAVHYAPVGDSGITQENEPLVIGNMLGNWTPKFANGKLLLGFNSTISTANHFSSPAPTNADNASTAWGFALYSKYKITDFFSIATRGEYVHNDDDQFLALGGVTPTSDDIWGWTTTFSFDVIENMMLRTEYRIDWGDDLVTTSGNPSSGPVHTTAVEVVCSF